MPTRRPRNESQRPEPVTLADLRKVAETGAHRGEAKFRVVEGDRVVDKIVKDRLYSLVADLVVPRLESAQAVQIRWSHVNRRGMTPWVFVVGDKPARVNRTPEKRLELHYLSCTTCRDNPGTCLVEQRLIAASRSAEKPIYIKDGAGLMHIIPIGLDDTTRCGIDVWSAGAVPIALTVAIPRCARCWP